jgi:hypothetical protein
MQLKLHAKSRGMTITTVARARLITPSVESLATEDRLAADLETRRTAGRSKGGTTTKGRPWSESRKRRVKSDPGSE